MGESTKFDLTVSAEVAGDYRYQRYEGVSNQPNHQATLFGGASLAGALYLPTIKDEVDLSMYLKFAGGGGTLSDTPITRSSRLFGHFDRFDYGRSRDNIYKDHLGVYEAYATVSFKTPGLSIMGGIFPQDSKVYPNHLNTAPCTVNGVTTPCYISRGNPPDNSVWTDLFTAHIGPGVGVDWSVPFIKGLQFTLISSTGIPPINANSDDPDLPFGKRWITTVQALWSKEYEIGKVSSSSLGSIFYSNDQPANSQNDKKETLSPTDCLGLYTRQVFGPFQMVATYGFNKNQINSADLQIENFTQSVNLGLRYSLFKDRLFFNSTFSWIGFSTKERSAIVQNEASGNEYTVEGSATVALIQGLALTGGWRGFIADSGAQAVVDGASFHSSAYLFATYTRTFSWGGGK